MIYINGVVCFGVSRRLALPYPCCSIPIVQTLDSFRSSYKIHRLGMRRVARYYCRHTSHISGASSITRFFDILVFVIRRESVFDSAE